uniref:Uncharacterized protein n=2 Tax=Kalmanozyma brasiliensis (strain GHG001) TaxID=1365824 RepID=V5ED50_KALBG
MRRGTGQQDTAQTSTPSSAAVRHDAELRAHRHLLATIEESHWSKPDAEPPSSDSIRAWRRKLAAWYYLDRDPARYPDAPSAHGDREETYARWNPDLELPYALDDEIMAPMISARPDPIADPRAAWAYARTHDASVGDNLNQDEQVREALATSSVASALQQLLRAQIASREAADAASDAPEQDSTQVPPGAADSADNAHDQPASEAIGDADPDVSLTRTTSLSRRNAVRSLPLTNSDASSIRSARSSLSLRRARNSFGQASTPLPAHAAAQDEADAIEEDIVETSMEIGTVPHSPEPVTTGPFARPPEDVASESSLLPPPDRPRAARSGSFTFITTPAAVLRSTRRSESRSRADPRSQSPAAPLSDDADAEAEEYIDLDLDLGMAGEDGFDFDLVDFLRSESRRHARRSSNADDDGESVDASPPSVRRRRGADEGDDPPAGDIRVFVSGSGASTPAEARQATFEAYAQRARVLERRRRLERQRQDMEEDGVEAAVGGGNASQEASSEGRRRRRGRNVGGSTETEEESDRRNSLPFPRTSER